ncbi:MAG: type II toxin-antitoxin system HicB family antitoxin [Candidatus Magasanikbacteria bacterium]|nr:type II toxin-antitoxin system HicB family antitoxin [Candidatus Magasanikbacteria bacterium]
MKNKIAHNYNFQVLYEQDEDGLYVAKVPALPGCHTQGKTIEEAIEEAEDRIKEAIGVYMD